MRRLPFVVACLATVATACGDGRGTLEGTGGGTTGGEAPPARVAYAESPLTPFALGMTRLALAALADEQLPDAPPPLEAPLGSEHVRSPDGGAPRGELRPVAFLFRADLAVTAAGAEAPAWMRVSALLTRHGLRILELSPRHRGDAVTSLQVSELGALGGFFTDALRRSGTSPSTAGLGEADVALIGEVSVSEALDGLMRGTAPLPTDLGGATPVRARLGDVAILVRDSAGESFLLEMGIETHEDALRVRGSPLVTVVPVSAR